MEEIGKEIKRVASEVFDIDVEPEVTLAPEGQSADYASNVAMKLTGILKANGVTELAGMLQLGNTAELENTATDLKGVPVNPRNVAEIIKSRLAIREENDDNSFPFTVEIAGPGFLNFISRDEYFKQKLVEMTDDFAGNISQDEYAGKTVICEFSDPNPFKVLHVGHLYTSIVGDAISRLIENAGGKVIRANFGGDVGLHVAKTIYAMQKQGISARDIAARDMNGDEVVSSEEIANKIEIIAKCYVEGTRAYEDDAAAKVQITELNKVIYAIVKEDVHDTELAELYWTGRELSYRYFEDFYGKLSVKFDKYYPESTVAEKGLFEIKAHVPDVYEESDGAIVYVGERDGLHTRVFINKEGLPTYETKDVGLLFTKWDDYHFDKSIVITGNDIIDYMKVVLSSVSKYAPELVERTEHITHGNVRLPGNEKMSSRKGNFIKAIEVLEAVEALAGQASASADALDTSARHEVAMAAIKYAFLKYRIGGNIEFDIKESVSTTGNSGVYLLYSAVRAKNIIKKCGDGSKGEWVLNQNEKNLIKKLVQYREVISEAVRELSPHKLTNYLYEIAQEFSRFYENVKVAGSEHEKERKQIVTCYFNVMEHGLGLLGIKVPEKM